MFVRWWRLDSEHRLRIWKLYGWFTGLVCVGSCAGAVCYAAWAQWLYNYYLSPRPTPFTNTTLENGPEDIESAVFYGTVSHFPDRRHRRLACALRAAQLPIIYPFAVFPMADCGSHHIPGSIQLHLRCLSSCSRPFDRFYRACRRGHCASLAVVRACLADHQFSRQRGRFLHQHRSFSDF